MIKGRSHPALSFRDVTPGPSGDKGVVASAARAFMSSALPPRLEKCIDKRQSRRRSVCLRGPLRCGRREVFVRCGIRVRSQGVRWRSSQGGGRRFRGGKRRKEGKLKSWSKCKVVRSGKLRVAMPGQRRAGEVENEIVQCNSSQVRGRQVRSWQVRVEAEVSMARKPYGVAAMMKGV